MPDKRVLAQLAVKMYHNSGERSFRGAEHTPSTHTMGALLRRAADEVATRARPRSMLTPEACIMPSKYLYVMCVAYESVQCSPSPFAYGCVIMPTNRAERTVQICVIYSNATPNAYDHTRV